METASPFVCLVGDNIPTSSFPSFSHFQSNPELQTEQYTEAMAGSHKQYAQKKALQSPTVIKLPASLEARM